MRITQRKGDIAKAHAISTFTKLGYDVAILITESAAYDLLVDDSVNIHRVQVKYCSSSTVSLRNIHSNAQGYVVKKTLTKTYDWLYVYCPDGKEFLLKDCLLKRNSINTSMLEELVWSGPGMDEDTVLKTAGGE